LAVEGLYGRHTPAVVYSDLEVVDDDLHRIHPSYMAYQKLVHEPSDPSRVLVTQNFVTGCAAVANGALLNLAVPVPKQVILHDWWVALCAAACGRLEYLPLATVRYRQHAGNQIGAEGFVRMVNPLSPGSRRRIMRGAHEFLNSVHQAASLSERIASRGISCPAEIQSLLKGYSAVAAVGRLRRVWLVSRLGLRRQGMMRAVLFYWRVIIAPRATQAGDPWEKPPTQCPS
jgi:hypothetical protein